MAHGLALYSRHLGCPLSDADAGDHLLRQWKVWESRVSPLLLCHCSFMRHGGPDDFRIFRVPVLVPDWLEGDEGLLILENPLVV